MNIAGKNVESKAKINAPVDEGVLRGSINSRYDDKAQRVTITAGGGPRGVFYAPYVEFGTKTKGKVPAGYQQFANQYRGIRKGKFADLKRNIAEWARKKGIPEEAVFPISMQIARRGVPARPFLIPAFESERTQLLNRLKRVLK